MILSAMALAIVVAMPFLARADNPIVQTSYTADPAPMVYQGTLYLFTSHDEDVTVNNFYTMNDWRLYSTTDMANWTDLGTPASLKTFSWSTDSAWAPQGIARNGKFYLYVPINNNTGAKIGVAVSNNVAGPYTDPLGHSLAASGSSNIDPTVFIDDDGQAYLYWGNGTLRWVKLNSDMISTSGSVTNVSLSGFTEGPWFYKRNSLYYMVYAATSGNEKISYATSSSPTPGTWNAKGDIMGTGSTYTNHPGVIDYQGHSYFFYHNSALSGGNNYKRSVCVEEFTYKSDGSIPTISMTTNGVSPVATLNPFTQVEAETIAFSSGLKTEVCSDTGGGMDVTSISNGDYIKVKNVDFLSGVTSFDARVSSAASSAKIELHLDSQSGTLLGTCDVSGASSWTTKTCSVSGGSGKHDLFLKFVGGSGDLFKFNWWRFSGPTMPDGGVGGSGAGGTTGPGTGGIGGSGQGRGGSGGTTSGSGGSGSGGATSGSGGATSGSGGATSGSGGATSGSGGATSGSGGNAGAGGTAPGSGGIVGTGGATSGSGGAVTGATGGAIGSGGSGSGGSAVSSGGSGSGAGGRGGGTPGVGGSGGNDAEAGGGGCACRMDASSGNGGLATALWLIAAAVVLRRRRR